MEKIVLNASNDSFVIKRLRELIVDKTISIATSINAVDRGYIDDCIISSVGEDYTDHTDEVKCDHLAVTYNKQQWFSIMYESIIVIDDKIIYISSGDILTKICITD